MESLSKNKIKYIHALELKKTRKEERVFLAECPKLVNELLGHFKCRFVAATAEWLRIHPQPQADEVAMVTEEELNRASLLKTPQQVLAIFEQPRHVLKPDIVNHSLCLALDNIQDPGNLGTIVRLADWFGIKNIICSPDTADIYSPKAMQATMGGIARVKVHYTPLADFIRTLKSAPVYGTFLNGVNIYAQPLSHTGLLVMGNEGNGISADIEALIQRRLYIPNFPPGEKTSESLNVAVATAIACAEFRRQAAWTQN